MKTTAMAVFFTIVLSVYTLVNFYIFIRGWQALQDFPLLRKVYLAVFLTLFLAYVAGRIFEAVSPCGFAEILIKTGSFWLAAMLYLFLLVLFADVFRLLFHFIPPVKTWLTAHREIIKPAAMGSAMLITATIIIIGYINASRPVLRNVSISINKNCGAYPTMKVVMVSDVHLGTLIANKKLSRMVDRINGLEPDLVLFAGDVVDENIEPVVRLNLGEHLLRIRSKLGVFGITGNHEFIGGAEASVAYLEKHGITMLRDTAVLVGNCLWIAGRNDRDMPRFTGKRRKELNEVLAEVDFSKPVLLMDHQPFHLEKTAEAGVDLQLSGHTHNGQLWPLNYITQAIYELDHGYLKKDNTHFYVSCGAGTWGPPLRLGNRPEIVLLHLEFKP
jgi:uncharacterized protein